MFSVGDLAQAKRIILTAEDVSSEERWRSETGYLVELLLAQVRLDASSVVLDYGCGIGRLAKELIARTGCSVLGADISASMRALATEYVGSERFTACAPAMLESMTGFRADAALAVWVLQHCLKPADDIARIRAALAPQGRLFAVNNLRRAVPTVEAGWSDDGIDVKALLSQAFLLREEGRLAQERTSAAIARHTFWASYTRLEG